MSNVIEFKPKVPKVTPSCQTCKYYEQDFEYWWLAFPVVGWAVFVLWWLTGKSKEYARCMHSTSYWSDVEKFKSKPGFCDLQRIFACGREGKFWSPQDK